MRPNPFLYGIVTPPATFLNRRQPLRHIAGRVAHHGQSSAIVGEPRMGKSSLLHYLAAPETRAALYGAAGERLLFSFVDVHSLGAEVIPAHFWKQALRPIETQFIDKPFPDELPRVQPTYSYEVGKRYILAEENQFGTFMLETLLHAVGAEGWRLVLLIDEFDVLLHHPGLNRAEFFGGLRSLATRSGALALVIASRRPLSELNESTQQLFQYTGSPYFNFLSETTLGALPDKDIAALLARAGDRFAGEDRRALRTLAGGHPFLLQAAAAALWDAHEEGLTEAEERRRATGQRLYREQRHHFADTWRTWPGATRKAFTTVALAHTSHLLPQRAFLTASFLKEMRDYGPELGDLESVGLLARDDKVQGGWRVTQEVMLWWLADELVRTIRSDSAFDAWLRAQELDHLLTRTEREQLGHVVQRAAAALQHGASTLIEAFAKGAVGG